MLKWEHVYVKISHVPDFSSPNEKNYDIKEQYSNTKNKSSTKKEHIIWTNSYIKNKFKLKGV